MKKSNPLTNWNVRKTLAMTLPPFVQSSTNAYPPPMPRMVQLVGSPNYSGWPFYTAMVMSLPYRYTIISQ